MADFCRQCTEVTLGMDPDENDLKGISTEDDTKNGLFALVICEGCGYIQVDHTGRCVSKDCLEKHNSLGES